MHAHTLILHPYPKTKKKGAICLPSTTTYVPRYIHYVLEILLEECFRRILKLRIADYLKVIENPLRQI